MRLGEGAILTFPGIDQPSTLTISHFLPTTAFIQRRNCSSETNRKRSSNTHSLGEGDSIHASIGIPTSTF